MASYGTQFSAERMAEEFMAYICENKANSRHVRKVGPWLGFMVRGIEAIAALRQEINALTPAMRRRPARASSPKSIVPLIMTRTSASFGIALLVTSEPTRAIRRTPGQVRAARTKDRTARSSSRRGSATEGLGL
jgi:hypothetical protein